MKQNHRHLAGAFAAMLFVGVSWGAQLPVTKVLLQTFDLVPLIAVRTGAGTLTVALLVWLIEGRRSLAIGMGLGRMLALGAMAASFYFTYALGICYSNPITAAATQVASPLVAAVTVRWVTGARFDPGFGVALVLTLMGGAILATSSLAGKGAVTFGGGEVLVLLSNALWTLYSLKVQTWFAGESQLHRSYVASLSAFGWLLACSVAMIGLGWTRSPFTVSDRWPWMELVVVAVLANGVGGYFWNVGANRLGVAIASLWINLMPFFAVLWAMAYGFVPNGYQIVGGLVALGGVVYMQGRKLQSASPATT